MVSVLTGKPQGYLPDVAGVPDKLQLYYGKEMVISDKLVVRQPKIKTIIDMGEKPYFNMISSFTSIPSDYISALWDMGLDWEEVGDVDLFYMLTNNLPPSLTKPVFGDVDFRLFVPQVHPELGFRMVNSEQGIVIDELVYAKIQSYLCITHSITKNIKKAATKKTKEMLVEIDRQDIEDAKKDKKGSYMLPLISSLVNHASFKYNKHEILEMNIFEFMDSVQRIQLGESVRALTTAYYSGCLDTKSFKTEKLSYMKDLYA